MDARADRPRVLTHSEARLIVIGMMLPIFMGSIDQTILATALPSIGREFGDLHTLPWLITTYLIASTAATPLYGKISDIHGRRFTIIIAVSCYMAGSLVCALAPSMSVLIVGRVLHGFGGGGLTSTGMVVLGDVAAPKDRARYYAYFSATYTTAGALGPLLGGFIAEHLHWSFIFWFNIPLGLAALTLTARLMLRLPRHERPHKLDLIGAVLIVVATVAFMLAVTMGGASYPWTSAPILALLGFAAATGALFVLRLMTAPEPLIPISILRDPIARCAIVANAFGWAAIIGLNIFLPMYLQNVLLMSATTSGLSLMVLMAVLNVSAGFSSPLIGRHQRYKTVPLIGLTLTTAGVLVLAWHAAVMTPWPFELLLAVIAVGFGPLAPLTTVALQNTVATHQFGTAVSTMTFLRSLLATVLVAVFGAIVAARGPAPEIGTGPDATAAASSGGFASVFLLAALCLAVALVATLLMREKPLQANTP